MRKTLFFLLFFSAFVIGCVKKNGCAEWRNGNFYLKLANGGKFYIQRKDSIQTEYLQKTGPLIHGKIEWLDDCEYRVNFTGIENPVKPVPDSLKHFSVRVQIVQSFNDHYIFHAETNLGQRVVDTLWVAEKGSGGFKAVGGVFNDN